MSSEKKSLIPDPPVPADRKYLILAGVFVLAFVLAFILAWALFRQDRAPIPTPDENAGLFPARVLDQEDLRVFIQAAEAEDYAALRDLGEELFTGGTRIPGSADIFGAYATTSYPPNTVYSFLYQIAGDKMCRVMLAIDQEDQVVSFMAEEMTIVK